MRSPPMTQGRHAAPRHTPPPGARRATGGSRKATPPVRGRRAAERQSPISVLRAGSDLTIAAVAPLAALSAACVFGLGAAGSGDPASAQAAEKTQSGPRPSASATEQVGKHRATTTQATTGQSSATQLTAGASESGVVVPAAGSVPTQQGSTSASPTKAEPTTAPAPVAPTVVETPAPVPTTLPTTEPTTEPTTAVLTEAEATAQCLESGISALDVTGLANCVADLLP